jgi:hypothetical protein
MAAAAVSTLSSTDNTTAAVYNDLLNFLNSPRADLRKAAAEATLATLVSSPPSTSSSADGDNGAEKEEADSINSSDTAAQRLTTLNAIQPLCRIASTLSPDHGSISALASLSVLSSHDLVGNQCILDFLDAKGISRMLEIALSSPPTPVSTAVSVSALASSSTTDNGELPPFKQYAQEWNVWRQQVNYACALLANATRTERGAIDFIGLSFPNEAVPTNLLSRTKKEEEEFQKEEEDDDEEKDTPDDDNNVRGALVYGKRETKPTATLLLSRFLNSAFIDTSSPAHEKAVARMNVKTGMDDLDEYDSDLENDDKNNSIDDSNCTNELEQQKIEPMGEEYYDPYQHVAAVIMNITQLETGREFLMRLIHSKKSSQSTSHLQLLLPQLNSPNLHRRQGIAGTLKNCCFAQDSIWWLLNVVHMDKTLLLPLAGPEELSIDEKVGLDPDFWLLGPQKVREPDSLVRLYVTEALLLLLASGRRARETLRERRMYVIIKLADMVEENEEVSERMLECVQYLRRDEEGTEEGSSDRRAYEKYAKGLLDSNFEKNEGLKALPMSTTSVIENIAHEEDYDNVD